MHAKGEGFGRIRVHAKLEGRLGEGSAKLFWFRSRVSSLRGGFGAELSSSARFYWFRSRLDWAEPMAQVTINLPCPTGRILPLPLTLTDRMIVFVHMGCNSASSHDIWINPVRN